MFCRRQNSNFTIKSFFSALVLILGIAQISIAQSSLFKFQDTELLAALHLEKSEIATFPVTPDFSTLQHIRNRSIAEFTMQTPGGQPLLITIRRVTEYAGGSWSVSGYVDNDPLNSFTLSESSGKIFSQIRMLSEHTFYEIKYHPQAQQHILAEIDPHKTDVLSCGVNHEFEISEQMLQQAAPFHAPVTTEGTAVIDVMIIYTPAAADWAADNAGNIDNIMAQAMVVAQNSVDNSQVDIEFRLVHTAEVDYEESGNSSTDLRRLTASPTFNPFGSEFAGYMEEVHEWRDIYGADLVAMFTKTQDTGGVGWQLNSEFGRPEIGFSITRVQQGSGITHIHEMGHNMGSNHSRKQKTGAADENGGLYEYSTGWRWVGDDGVGYVSLMTYGEGDVEIEYFSNPDVTFAGVPTGSYDGEGAPADNARSLKNIKHTIAAYRQPAGEMPEIRFSDTEIDILVAPGSTQQSSFFIYNDGDAELEFRITDFASFSNIATGNKEKSDFTAASRHIGSVAKKVFESNQNIISNADMLNLKDYRKRLLEDENLIFYENFETYANFALQFEPWTLVDRDGSSTYGIQNTSYPNENSPSAFMIFNPTQTNPPLGENWNPLNGNTKYAASFASVNPPNDDWMISPPLSLGDGSSIAFWARSQTDSYGLERLRFGVSNTKSPSPEDFTMLTDEPYIEVSTSWTQYEFDISEYDNSTIHFAFNSVSDDAFTMFIDEISVYSALNAWLTIQPEQGVITPNESEEILLTVDASELEPGTYRRTLRVLSNAPRSTVTDIQLNVVVTENENQITLIKPENNSTNTEKPVDMRWSNVEADSYILEIIKISGAQASFFYEDITTNQFAFNEAKVASEYEWRVAPVTGSEQGEWSESFTFTTLTGLSAEVPDGLPTALELHQNYPNPFNPITKITYGVPQNDITRLEVFDMLGRRVAILVSETLEAGWHEATFDASGLTSGMYIYRLQQGSMSISHKMMLIK